MGQHRQDNRDRKLIPNPRSDALAVFKGPMPLLNMLICVDLPHHKMEICLAAAGMLDFPCIVEGNKTTYPECESSVSCWFGHCPKCVSSFRWLNFWWFQLDHGWSIDRSTKTTCTWGLKGAQSTFSSSICFLVLLLCFLPGLKPNTFLPKPRRRKATACEQQSEENNPKLHTKDYNPLAK